MKRRVKSPFLNETAENEAKNLHKDGTCCILSSTIDDRSTEQHINPLITFHHTDWFKLGILVKSRGSKIQYMYTAKKQSVTVAPEIK